MLVSSLEREGSGRRHAARAHLLRSWRTEVAGMGQAAAAAALGVSVPALSMWERGGRRVGAAHLQQMDALYGANGALVDLAWAIESPLGIPPRTMWAYNPQGPSRPHWAWIRPRPGCRAVEALLLWGAFAFDCSGPCDDRGRFITSPISMPNPPAWVHLREPGWVDFGQGVLPETLGVPAVDPVSVATLSTGGQSPVGLVAPEIVSRFRRDPRFAAAVVQFFGQREELIRVVFTELEPRTYVTDLTGSSVVPRPASEAAAFPGALYRALREARGLSQADAARLATGLLREQPVTDDQIGLLEHDGDPRPRWLRARLDTIYRADGHACCDDVGLASIVRTRSSFVIEFPAFWIGPVWVALWADRPAAPSRMHLRLGANTKDILARPPVAIAFRRPVPDEAPLEVHCPPGWRIHAGMGIHPDARDVNWGWRTVDDVSSRGTSPVHELFLGLFGRTRSELDRLLEGLGVRP